MAHRAQDPADHPTAVILCGDNFYFRLTGVDDPRFKTFNELPEDHFESFLSVPLVSRGHIVGVINLQSKKPHHYSRREIRMISTIGFLVGAEIQMARLESANSELSDQLKQSR